MKQDGDKDTAPKEVIKQPSLMTGMSDAAALPMMSPNSASIFCLLD